jgi:hypothetical protein
LWKQSAHAKLLQRPPTHKTSLKQAALLQDTRQELVKLATAITKAAISCQSISGHSSAQPGIAFLDVVLAARPVATLSQLLVWLQQGAALLQLPELAAELGSATEGSAAAATDGNTSSTSSSSSNSIPAAEIAAASGADVSSRSCGGGEFGTLWMLCTSGALGHAHFLSICLQNDLQESTNESSMKS